MAKYIWLWMVVVLAVASTSAALKCHFCGDCENESSIAGPCPANHDRCVISHLGGKVQKSCAPQNMCDMANQAKDMMKSMKGMLGDHATAEMNAEMKAATGGSDSLKIECCATDYCNTASNKMMNSALLFLLPLALYILHC